MKSRDVVGKRIVEIRNEQMGGDPEYYGPRVICTAIYLEDGTSIVADVDETSDCPVGHMNAVLPTKKEIAMRLLARRKMKPVTPSRRQDSDTARLVEAKGIISES